MPEQRKQRAVTITDVANRLGLSPATVSRGLNRSNLISTEVRNKVVATAREMGYENRFVKRHATRTTLNIQLFVPEDSDWYSVKGGNLNSLVSNLRRGFSDTEVNFLVNTESGHSAWVKNKTPSNLDACIFAYTKPTPAVERTCINRHVPLLLLNRVHVFHNFAVCDDCASVRLLVSRFARSPYRRVRPAFIATSVPSSSTLERERGFIEGCREARLRIRDRDIIRIHSLQNVRGTVLDTILKRGYSAVICQNDQIAVALYQAASMRAIRVPDQFALSGFGNTDALELIERRVDTIDPNMEELALAAGKWLQGVIIDRSSEPLRLSIPGSLIPGDTV